MPKKSSQKPSNEYWSLIAAIAGVLLAFVVPDISGYFYFIGKIYLSILKMLVLPIVIISLLLAFAKISSLTQLKSLGFRTFIYYISSSMIALVTGMTLARVFIFSSFDLEEGQIDPVNLDIDLVERIFSTNIFASLANGEILHVVVGSILVGMAICVIDDQKKNAVVSSLETVYEIVLTLVRWVLRFTPIAVFSLIWSTVSSFDWDSFSAISSFFVATGFGVVIHTGVSLPLIAKFFGHFNAFDFAKKVRQPLIVSLATASSSATLPVSTKTLEEIGVGQQTTRFVLPLGATLNMDGSALYQGILAMLFVSLSQIPISMGQQFLVFLLILLSSAGTAGIPSGGIVMMTMVLSVLNIPNPDYYLGIYILVDRFWDYPITTVNVWGDLIGAKTIDQTLKS